ncbi:receptor activity-modifying protein 1-like [Pholidichthys leucotaenia]
MAVKSTVLLKAGLVLLMAAKVLPSVSSCDKGSYEMMISISCLTLFHEDMAALGQHLWCSWPDTLKTYEELTNCTYQEALKMDCFWPNQVVDHFFMEIHQIYFHDCALTGRLPHEPPMSILVPFIAVPVMITLLMTALVVWRSKHTEGVL